MESDYNEQKILFQNIFLLDSQKTYQLNSLYFNDFEYKIVGFISGLKSGHDGNLFTWEEAESICQTNLSNGHLWSAQSKEEEWFVVHTFAEHYPSLMPIAVFLGLVKVM